MTKKVYILGAGFSYAASEAVAIQMPLMRELSQEIARDLNTQNVVLPKGANFQGDFEAFLTFLFDNQPWLTDGENLRNSAAYIDVTSSLERAISTAQNEVYKKPIEPWLAELLLEWRANNSTVITFNYDEIVESAARQLLRGKGTGNALPNIYAIPLTLDSSRGTVAGTWGTERYAPFTLLKLHGSVSWYYSGPDSPPGDTVYRRADYASWSARKSRMEYDNNTTYLVDKEPLIVPPTAIKTGFYSNKILSAQWQRARQALNSADELYILGYSAPESDLMVRTLVGTEFHGAKLVCANPDPKSAERICEFMQANGRPKVVHFGSIKDYVGDIDKSKFFCTNHPSQPDRVSTDHGYTKLSRLPRAGDHCYLCPDAVLQESYGSDGVRDFSCPCCHSRWRTTSPSRWSVGSNVHESTSN